MHCVLSWAPVNGYVLCPLVRQGGVMCLGRRVGGWARASEWPAGVGVGGGAPASEARTSTTGRLTASSSGPATSRALAPSALCGAAGGGRGRLRACAFSLARACAISSAASGAAAWRTLGRADGAERGPNGVEPMTGPRARLGRTEECVLQRREDEGGDGGGLRAAEQGGMTEQSVLPRRHAAAQGGHQDGGGGNGGGPRRKDDEGAQQGGGRSPGRPPGGSSLLAAPPVGRPQRREGDRKLRAAAQGGRSQQEV